MLPKNNRVPRKTIDQIFKAGRSVNSPSLNFKFILKPGISQISVIAPKGVAKSAVKRNLLRRRGYSALRKQFQDVPSGIQGALILKSPTLTTELFEKEIKIILSKLK